jgi:hypothetical protein
MKAKYSFVFFVLLVVVIAGIFFFINKFQAKGPTTLRQTLDCHHLTITDSIMDLDGDTTLIGAYINFKTLPLNVDSMKKMDELNILLDDRSQLFEISPYILAEIPTNSLCELAMDDNVVAIFIQEDNGI